MYSEAKTAIAQKRNLITAIPGPKSEQLIKRRAEAVSASLGTAFPVFIERAEGSIIIDVDGNSILDLGAGIAVLNVGHSSARVIENVKTQRARLALSSMKNALETINVELPDLEDELVKELYEKTKENFKPGNRKNDHPDLRPVEDGGTSYWSRLSHRWVKGRFVKSKNQFYPMRRDKNRTTVRVLQEMIRCYNEREA